MERNDDILRAVQLEQLAMLRAVDRFCRRHEIRYSLYAGTLLGAVRHRGFIPWDDDLDICMPRADYERFLRLWKNEGEYVLQNKDNTPSFTQSFTKLRKRGTTFLTAEDRERGYHTGIFLDIFPVDRLPRGRAARMLFLGEVMVCQLMTREFVPEAQSLPVRLTAGMLLKLVGPGWRDALRRLLLRRITARRSPDAGWVTIETVDAARQWYSPDLFDRYVELPFEDGLFRCVADWDQLLRVKYGDYMQLPPQSERHWKHRPLVIDFDREWKPEDSCISL